MQTILFLCGSLESGRDGVGDYTRCLADELVRQGYRAAIVALNDKYLTTDDHYELGPTNDLTVNTLRLSQRLSWRERTRRASTFIGQLNPIWLSLQYVPFAFHSKGLPYEFEGVLKQLRRGRPLHVFFHELWVGMQRESARQHWWWGQVQRYLIWSLLNSTRPTTVHTHTPLYALHLERLGMEVELLPLFTNISRTAATRTRPDADMALRFVLFGGIFPGAPVESLAEEVAAYAQQHHLAANLTLVGRNGAEQARWTRAWEANGLPVRTLGEQTPEIISATLSEATIGLSTTPIWLWGKSGTIAAMHTHDLPVLCVSAPWTPRLQASLPPTAGLFDYRAGHLAQVLQQRTVAPRPGHTLARVASQLLRDLAISDVSAPISIPSHP